MKHSIQILGWLGSAFALAACGAPLPAETDAELAADAHETSREAPGESSGQALYSATLDDGSTLEIRQEGGLVLLSGTTPQGVTPLAERYDLSVPITELVQQIFPERAVPEVLVAAQLQEEEFWRNLPDSDAPTDLVPDEAYGSMGEAAAVVPKDAFHGSFEATNCSTDRLNHQPITALRHLNWCRLHWTGGFHSGVFNNKRQGYGAVQVYGGSVNFQRNWRVTGASTWTTSNWTVTNNGSAFWAEAHSGSNAGGVDVWFEVQNASGDSFHASGMYADRLSCWSLGTACVNVGGWQGEGCFIEFHQCNDGTTPNSSCLGPCVP